MYKYYTSQQGVTLPIDLRAVWNKQDDVDYPFVGILTNLDNFNPVAIGDRFEEPTTVSDFFYTINEVKTCILIQAVEIREVQRLRSFTEINLMWGRNPVSNQRWLTEFQNAGMILDSYSCTNYERVGFESIQQRSENSQGREFMRLANIETLWEVELTLNSKVQVGVATTINDPSRAVIQQIFFNVSPQFN